MQTLVEQFISKNDIMQEYFKTTLKVHEGNYSINELEKVIREHFKILLDVIAEYDAYTGKHLYTSAQIAEFLGTQIGLSHFDLAGLVVGSQMHDIGKVGIPKSILLKPGKFTEGERRIMDTHVDLGYCILSHLKTPWDLPQYALMHHEKLDGTGYPNKLVGDEIPLTVRILTVADIVESLTADRPYRQGQTLNEVIDYLYSEEGKYDKSIIKMLEGFANVA